jgi:hypothetical protein
MISHVDTEFLDCFVGGLSALNTSSRFTCPQIIPHGWALGETYAFGHAGTDHPCSKRSENLPGCSFYPLHSKYAHRSSVPVEIKMVSVLCVVPGLSSNLPNFTFHAWQCHSSVHRLSSCRTLFQVRLFVNVHAPAMQPDDFCGATLACSSERAALWVPKRTHRMSLLVG